MNYGVFHFKCSKTGFCITLWQCAKGYSQFTTGKAAAIQGGVIDELISEIVRFRQDRVHAVSHGELVLVNDSTPGTTSCCENKLCVCGQGGMRYHHKKTENCGWGIILQAGCNTSDGLVSSI